MSIDRVSK